jgi:diguanylate cyclase (GGDEF)-like protein/PAS domain S-box-containing protein
VTLRKQLLLVITITLLVLLLVVYVGSGHLIMRSIIELDESHTIEDMGRVLTRNLLVSVLIAGLVYYLLVLFSLEKMVFSKLAFLVKKVENVGENLTERLDDNNGRDELSYLGRNINKMLDRLEHSRSLVLSREARMRLITDNMLDMISQVDMEGNLQYVSPSHQVQLGYDPTHLVGRNILSLVCNDDRDMVRNVLTETARTLSPSRCEYRTKHAEGDYIWVESVGKPIFNEQGKPVGGVISSRDITERKQMEEQLRYLSLHDALTGLYNRTYFEQEMQRLGKSRLEKVGLIICDVDGLKLFNDTMGHKTGDILLKTSAEVIRRCFREGDMVARIGGDEFAVLLPESSESMVENAVRRIRGSLDEYNRLHPDLPLSISMGFAVSSIANINTLFKEADDSMYREKLNCSQSARSSTVQILMKALAARDFITEGHADRLQSLVASLAEAAGLPEHRITDLRILAQFHDIGKVGTPDRILFKKGSLNSFEMAEMRRHCEIGYRIAISAPDLVPIAGWILKHHEWWNGQGYPNGLAGCEIPLECRILAIADAYDAMTSDRPYRKAMSKEAALEEIRRCAGTQFDPELAEKFIILVENSNLNSAPVKSVLRKIK